MSIIQFGVALFLRMNIGSDPFTVFTQGLANTLNNLGVNATTGTANRIILIVLFILLYADNMNDIKVQYLQRILFSNQDISHNSLLLHVNLDL